MHHPLGQQTMEKTLLGRNKQINLQLNEHEQILLQRYIDAERQEPNFIERGLSKHFVREVFIYFYYGGHGCSDIGQYIVLNGKEVDEIFWPAERKIKLILKKAGSNCKAMVVFDCCREDMLGAKERVESALKKMKF